MRPIIKWAVGKTRLLPDLLRHVPAQFNRYYEPFAGGAALFFHLEPECGVIGDVNRDLVNLYSTVGKQVDDVIRHLTMHRRLHNETHYYEMRARWNDANVSWTHVDRAAAFIYLNKACFNGLWRVNRAGHLNTPIGNPDHLAPIDEDGLLAAARLLNRTTIRSGGYRHTAHDATMGDFVYFDPPYVPVSETANFTGYTQGGFTLDDHHDLAEFARSLRFRGCHVMISNSDVRVVREIYKGLDVHQVTRPGTMNSDPAKRGRVGELILTGGPL